MLFFMVFTTHFAPNFKDPGGSAVVVWILFVLIWAGAELSALGKFGGLDNPFCVKVLNDHKKTIYAGLVRARGALHHRLGDRDRRDQLITG